MDPDACLRRLLDALSEGDFAEALHACNALNTWLLDGGYAPSLSRDDLLGLIVHVYSDLARTARDAEGCSHKFIDSKVCLKCGWKPPKSVYKCVEGTVPFD